MDIGEIRGKHLAIKKSGELINVEVDRIGRDFENIDKNIYISGDEQDRRQNQCISKMRNLLCKLKNLSISLDTVELEHKKLKSRRLNRKPGK